ncbi:hypothetical protein FKR81_19310 [Lentzea tibetensis]|uniref:Uncharacterized protein n=1 Tax=Lentzea tibetensis TaxID=2591470 RepID=A0A563ESP8_9PSEU|nr:hypothetical protein [Lentzea tibetensis]TWP50755.1 hypothetical protein FKR81_19310 [Lentzea tibetensis]
MTDETRPSALTAQEVAHRYGEFLKSRGFALRRAADELGFTAAGDGASHTVVVVDGRLTDAAVTELAEQANRVVVVLSGAIERPVVHHLTVSGVRVVWWNGTIWNGSGTAYAAGLTTA